MFLLHSQIGEDDLNLSDEFNYLLQKPSVGVVQISETEKQIVESESVNEQSAQQEFLEEEGQLGCSFIHQGK